MPRGGKRGHKGQRRHFTNPDQLDADKEKEERQRNWRREKEDGDDDDDDEEETEESSSEESDSDDEASRNKGVSHLIEISNPNRVVQKNKKFSQLDNDNNDATKPELSRREREEIEKQQARIKYNALHAAGKTEEARTDLARLAIIRQQREDAAKKKEGEKKAQETRKVAKS